MYKLLILVFLNGEFLDIADEGFYSNDECHKLGSRMIYLNNEMGGNGISLKYSCVMGS